GFIKPMLALYVGGMGARGKNFYNDLACRYGFEAEAKKIQDLYLAGQKGEAIAAVPDELADEISLVGPPERIKDRLGAWKQSGATTIICALQQPEAARTMAEALL
ncbi:MAG: LLM class flavin-dependent oxidoreductase, partial [Candidatus Binatia bacterium]